MITKNIKDSPVADKGIVSVITSENSRQVFNGPGNRSNRVNNKLKLIVIIALMSRGRKDSVGPFVIVPDFLKN